ncbi:MAG TPA: hypothetical protein VLM85_01625, partial [Polyangiaceae bacterium]|nr:hypothetical protein [Polyangiaceae bacterium]
MATPPEAERWTPPGADAAAAEELVALQRDEAVGGFLSFTREDGGALLLTRAPAQLTIASLAKPLPWREALERLACFARALAACERRSARLGALLPEDLVLSPVCHLRADALVAEMLSSAPPASARTPTPRFMPPEQASGAPWDAAARRYVLGLAAYRMIAGALPFSGESLRRDLAERSSRGVPPFDDAIARELRPGVQAFVLRTLAPRSADRPRSAHEIARECEALLEDASPAPPRRALRPSRPAVAAPRATKPTGSAPPRKRWGRERLLSMALVGAGALVAALGALAGPGPQKTARAPMPPAAMRGTRPADCAGCHPREVAEWQRSVMAHASKSPLFGALESAVEEQVGKSARCPLGAGVLRHAGGDACFDERTGLRVTGAGGEGWCINCHAPGDNLTRERAPEWSAVGDPRSRQPLRDILSDASLDGISCAVCHQTVGPVGPHREGLGGAYDGNATWTSFVTGSEFASRPEDNAGVFGIGNSGYRLDPLALAPSHRPDARTPVHGSPSASTEAYLRSSELCGACHDVRLFGTDVLGAARSSEARARTDGPIGAEDFKRLRNAYSEWRAWADGERSAGRTPATCQGCHMSQYPGVCQAAAGSPGDADCPKGTRFAARPPAVRAVSHYFTSVEVPLTPDYPDEFASDSSLDGFGVPIGLRQRRDMLLRHTFRMAIDGARRSGAELRVPLEIENVGAGHRVPAGFSQEREIWVELEVRDARGGLVYQVGHVDRPDEDLADKRFLRVSTADDARDLAGRPLGVFGADVVDGPDVGQWSPPPSRGGTSFIGKGLVNFQNGFLRCVRCIGTVDPSGVCQPAQGQGRTRADRFDDGAYDIDTGECRSNLSGTNALFETYFPIGALDADRGVTKAPDAIVDTRSAPPGVPVHYTYVLDAG